MRTCLILLILLSFFNASAQVTADAGPDRKTCVNDSLHVSGKGLNTGDTGSYEWKALKTGQVASSTQNLVIDQPAPGQQEFELTVTRISKGITYTDKDSFILIVNGLPVIQIAVPDTVCSSSSPFALNNIMPAGAVGTWSGTGVSGRNFEASFSSKTKLYEGPFTVRFSYTHPVTGCTNSDSESLLIQTQPQVTILNSKPYQLCEGQVFNLQASSKWAFNVIWTSSGDGTLSTPYALQTTYTHGYVDTANGKATISIQTLKFGVCPSARDDIELIFHTYPQFIVPTYMVGCEPYMANFSMKVIKPVNTTNLRYSWDFGNGDTLMKSLNGNPKNIQYDTARKGWYNVSVTLHNRYGANMGQSCDTKLDLPEYVRILPQPLASFTSNPAYYATTSSPTFNFTNKTSVRFGKESMIYLWNFDKSNDTSTQRDPVHTYPADTGSYWVNMLASYQYIDGSNSHLCSDSSGQPRKVGPSTGLIALRVLEPNASIELSFPFDGQLIVIDAMGRIIRDRRVDATSQEVWDIRLWASGNYVIIISDGDRKITRKFIKY